MYHVIGLKQTCGIKNVTLKKAKNFVGVSLLGRVILSIVIQIQVPFIQRV